jgi:hypothetical protein
MKFKSKIIRRIKHWRVLGNIALAWFLIYNTYFGWNKETESIAEQYCDYVLMALIFLYIGMIINVFVEYLEYRVNRDLSELNNEDYKKIEKDTIYTSIALLKTASYDSESLNDKRDETVFNLRKLLK